MIMKLKRQRPGPKGAVESVKKKQGSCETSVDINCTSRHLISEDSTVESILVYIMSTVQRKKRLNATYIFVQSVVPVLK
jgi:hypothetical protein